MWAYIQFPMLQYHILPKYIWKVWGTAQFPPNTALAYINSARMQHWHATNSATQKKKQSMYELSTSQCLRPLTGMPRNSACIRAFDKEAWKVILCHVWWQAGQTRRVGFHTTRTHYSVRWESKDVEKSNKACVVVAASCAPLVYMAADGLGRFSDIVCFGDLEAN